MNATKTFMFAVCLVGLIGCKKSETASTNDTEPAKTIDVVDLSPMNEADVREILTQWQTSQNESDFDVYSSLFAEKFEGLKRVGPSVGQFDQAAWLREQGERFRNKSGVKIDEPSISMSGMTAVVRFTEQPTRKDSPSEVSKVLVLEKSAAGTKIVREEGVQIASTGPAEAFDANRWAPVLLGEFLVLSDSVDETWLTDTKRLVGEGPMIGTVAVAETWVDVAKLPLALRSLKGRTFTLAGSQDCRATVQGFRVLSHVTPHFSSVENWKARKTTKESQGEMAGEIVEMASTTGRVLVAKLDKRCPQAIWGQAVKDTNDRVFTVEAGQSISDDVLDVVRKTKAWNQVEKDAAEYGVSDWFDPSTTTYTVFSNGKQQFGVLALKVGTGCGEFYAEYSAIIELGENPRVVHDIEQGVFFTPKSVMGISGDIIFISDERAGKLDSEGFKFVISWAAPYLDCAC